MFSILSEELIEKMQELDFSEEQIEFIKKDLIKELYNLDGHKVHAGYTYKVIKQHNKGNTYYKIIVHGKDMKGNEKIAYKDVNFVGCNPPRGAEDVITIKSLFEDFYFGSNDKWNARWIIKITDYEYASDIIKEVREEQDAFEQYRKETIDSWNDLTL